MGRVPKGIFVPDFHLRDAMGRAICTGSQRETKTNGFGHDTMYKSFVTPSNMETISTKDIVDIPLTSFHWQLPKEPLFES